MNDNYLTAKNASNLINNGMPTEYWNYVYDDIKAKNASVKDCPAVTPYYNGLACINCTAPTQYFNLDTRRCQACSNSSVYDATKRDCIDMSKGTYDVSGSALKMSGTLFSHQKELMRNMHSRVNMRHLVKARN